MPPARRAQWLHAAGWSRCPRSPAAQRAVAAAARHVHRLAGDHGDHGEDEQKSFAAVVTSETGLSCVLSHIKPVPHVRTTPNQPWPTCRHTHVRHLHPLPDVERRPQEQHHPIQTCKPGPKSKRPDRHAPGLGLYPTVRTTVAEPPVGSSCPTASRPRHVRVDPLVRHPCRGLLPPSMYPTPTLPYPTVAYSAG
jgi:hypothetical protein